MSKWRKHPLEDFPDPHSTPWPIGFPIRSREGNDDPVVREPDNILFPRVPETQMQALMEAPPGKEPERSVEDEAVLKELLADAIDALDERLKWVFTAYHFRGLSHSQIGDELNMSKSNAHWLYQKAVEQLAEHLGDNPAVIERLTQ